MRPSRNTSIFVVLIAIVLNSPSLLTAQTREAGPWWPHAVWGPEDQAGASNWITPQKVLAAMDLVSTGVVHDLGQPYEQGMPLFGQRTYALHIPGSPTYEPFGENKLVGHDEFICGELGQVGTQFDGLGHIGTRLEMADGMVKDVFYNGIPVDEMRGAYGLQKLGIEHIKPIITRGILVDVAGYKGVDVLNEGYEVTVEDVLGALARQGIDEASITPGDAIFFRYGWSAHWDDPSQYNGAVPGIGLAVAAWLIDKQVSMIGSDTYTSEVVPNPDPDLAFPVHQELITKNGIFNLENLRFDTLVPGSDYEFLFVFAPIPFVGGTGSPGRPIAIL